MIRKIFGKNRKRDNHRTPYSELSVSERVAMSRYNTSLRPVGDDKGQGHIYHVSNGSISLIWSSTNLYPDAIKAYLAADEHIRKFMKQGLANTPEERLPSSTEFIRDPEEKAAEEAAEAEALRRTAARKAGEPTKNWAR